MKQVIVVRKDLDMPPGKMAAQCCHGCIGAYRKSSKNKINKWKRGGAKKVVVSVKNLKALKKIKNQCKKKGIKSYLVKDAGHTVLKPGTITVLAIGPDEDDEIDEITSSLPLLD